MLALDILGICNVLIVPWGLFVSWRGLRVALQRSPGG